MSIHPTARMPEELRPHLGNYFPDSWRNYSLQELGTFVYLLTTRSLMRGSPEKRARDLYGARNYWRMIGAHLDAHELDAESHTYEFGAGAIATPGAPSDPIPDSLYFRGAGHMEVPLGEISELTEADRLVGVLDMPPGFVEEPPTGEGEPPGDIEEQEPPAGDVDLMGEVDEAPDTTDDMGQPLEVVREEFTPKPITRRRTRKRRSK